MFTPSERDDFARHGLLKRRNFLPQEKITAARKVIFTHLEQQGIWQDSDWSLGEYTYSMEPGAGMKLLKPLWRDQTMIDLINDEALAAASALANERLVLPDNSYPSLLFTLPNATTWTLPHQVWHLDMPRLPDDGVPGVQIFTFLEKVEPGGGGTLAITGSHRMPNEGGRIKSGEFRKKLQAEPYFAELMSDKTGDRLRFMREVGYVGDVELKVVEMTGDVGDVYFMDMRVFHNISQNTLQIPRIMLTYRYHTESAHQALSGK